MSQRYLGGIITANPTTPTTASASGVWTVPNEENVSGATMIYMAFAETPFNIARAR